MIDENILLKWALWYQGKGYSVIPVKEYPELDDDGQKKVKKRPYIEWKEWQTKKPSPDQIRAWWTEHPKAMIGIVTGVISGISVIDADLYKMSDEEKAEFQKIFPSVKTPTAISPHGGEHYYFKYHAEIPSRAVGKYVDAKSNGGYIVAPPSAANGTGSYRWQEGMRIDKTPLELVPSIYLSSIRMYLGGCGGGWTGNTRSQTVTKSNMSFEEGTRDETIFHIANCLVKGAMPQEEIEQLLYLIGEKICIPAFNKREIYAKIQSAYKRENIKLKSIAEEVREFVAVTSGNFSVTDGSQWVTNGNKTSNKPILMELSRLCKAGIIERVGNRAGLYRKVESHFSVDDWANADTNPLDINLPLGMEKFCCINPGDLILISGVTNSGKTAFGLDFARLNMRRHKVFVFSSETKPKAFKKRIMSSDTPFPEWKINLSTDFSNMVDVVQPDDINIMDYIEPPGGDYRLIAQIIREIHAKLKKGIAVCLVQKKKSTKFEDYEFGAGGQMTMNKASLAINLDPDYPGGKCTMKKVKDRRCDFNPEGSFRRFKIVKGINIVPEGVWEEEA